MILWLNNNRVIKMRAVEKKPLEIFERIAKEGKKYGMELLIVSERPAELNTTIMSQCNNIVSLKVTNDRDKSAVAAMLPSKIILDKPHEKPKSAAIDFWDRWYDGKKTVFDIDTATLNLTKQSRG